MLWRATLAALAALSAVQAKIYDTQYNGTTWDSDTWVLTTTNLMQGIFQSRMSLANGYLGINVAALGPFFEVDVPVAGDDISGWPLFDRRQTFATIAGFYDSQATTNGTNFEWLYQYGGESVISGVPHWAGLHVEAGGDVLTASTDASQISNFTSSLSIPGGDMTWSFTWTPSSGPAIDVQYLMFVNKLHVNQATVTVNLTAKADTNVTVIDVLNGDCAVRSDLVGRGYETNSSVIWSAVSPHWLSDVKAYIYSTLAGDQYTNNSTRKQYTNEAVIGGNSSSIAQAVNVSLKAGQAATLTKYIGGASSDAYNDPQSVASPASTAGSQTGFNALFDAHAKEWQSIMTSDSVEDYTDPSTGELPDDPNVIYLQIVAITSPFHLLQNTIGTNALAIANNDHPMDVNSISVAGLGSSSYAGWIFWVC